jgi:hypothetical protein
MRSRRGAAGIVERWKEITDSAHYSSNLTSYRKWEPRIIKDENSLANRFNIRPDPVYRKAIAKRAKAGTNQRAGKRSY